MKKISLSKFDLGFIIAAVVIALLGAGAWWYLSGALQDAVNDVNSAKADFDKYSTKSHIVVSASNGKTLQANIDLLQAQLNPLIETKLLPKGNTLASVEKGDPVAWKHTLDDKVQALTAAAKVHGVALPPSFYFGFSRYISQSPSDEQTAVLAKQLIGIEDLSNILINAPVKDIRDISRSSEEDAHPKGAAGFAATATGNTYTAYPFDLDFDTTPENLRPVIANLVQSPYLFVIRTITVESSSSGSPALSDLDKMAGPPPASSDPNAPEATTRGPQYLFGNATLRVRIHLDMIEWKAQPGK
jgi:hypothetical protein